MAGCTSTPENASPSAGVPTAAAPTTAPAPESPPSTSVRSAPAIDPVAFFRAQEPGCRAQAKKYDNPPVESARFFGAKLVRALGDGAFLISDGLGTRLVVRPAAPTVLPESGNEADEMPAPYGAGCPPEVFKGTSD